MTEPEMKEMLKSLKHHLVENIVDYTPFPEPYMGKGEIKAIVMGMDPSTDDGRRFNTVFDIGGKDERYFKGIERNLNAVGLTMDNVFVQNFCGNYFTKTTYKQKKNWWRASAIWYMKIITDLHYKFNERIPILATSELLMKRLIDFDRETNEYYYKNPEAVPIEISMSTRRVFPFYRHRKYNLELSEWELYRNKLKVYFEGELPPVNEINMNEESELDHFKK